MYCQNCGFYLGETATTCGRCGWTYGQRPAPPGFMPPPPANVRQDDGMWLLLPVGRSGWAIAAGYAGLLSLAIFPAPLALILGIVAIIDIKQHPEKRGIVRAIIGIVLGALGTIALIAVFVPILFMHKRF